MYIRAEHRFQPLTDQAKQFTGEARQPADGSEIEHRWQCAFIQQNAAIARYFANKAYRQCAFRAADGFLQAQSGSQDP
ncbi:hypothetical protein D3C79_1040610 [compost metagenome]